MTTQHTAPSLVAGHAQVQAPRQTTSDRFELEEQILAAWQIIEDLRLLHQMNAGPNDMVKLATVYDYKFKRMWTTFESLVRAREL